MVLSRLPLALSSCMGDCHLSRPTGGVAGGAALRCRGGGVRAFRPHGCGRRGRGVGVVPFKSPVNSLGSGAGAVGWRHPTAVGSSLARLRGRCRLPGAPASVCSAAFRRGRGARPRSRGCAKPGFGCICAGLVCAAENDDTERSVRIAKSSPSQLRMWIRSFLALSLGLTRVFVPA